MSLTLRTLSNQGEPLCDQSGAVLANTDITFTLIDKFGNQCDVFDAITKQRVASVSQKVTTDSNGVFSVSLFPTSRADSKSYYLCKVANAGINDIYAPLVDGEGVLSWSTFKQSSGVLDSNEVSAFANHISDNARHLSINQNAALDAASNPSAANPVATMTDIMVAGGGHTIQDDGVSVEQQPKVNFVGDGVTVSSDSVNGAIVVSINGTETGNASTSAKGLVKLSVAPTDSANPVAVGANDTRLSDARTPLSHNQPLSTITDVTISASNLNTLDDGGDTSLHYHTADRNRANHTGTQAWATVSKTGSKLTDMADVPAPVSGKALKRKSDDTGYEWADISGMTSHENLSDLQGGVSGEHYHLSSAQLTDLIDSGDSSAHYHSTDRNRANHNGTQAISTVSGLQTALDAKVDASAVGSVVVKNVPTSGSNASTVQVVMGDDTRLSDVRTPTAHTQAINTVTGLQTALDAKVETSAVGSAASKTAPSSGSNASTTQVVMGDDTRLADARTPVSHTQAISTVTNLQTTLDNKVDKNVAITGATKTKITYDAKGLVTSGADVTTSDIAEGNNLYYTDVRAAAAAPVQSVAGKVGSVTLVKTDVGLGNVSNVDTTVANNITQDASHRFVTDSDKSTWNGKQNALSAGSDYLAPTGSQSSTTGIGGDVATALLGKLSTTAVAADSAKLGGVAASGYMQPAAPEYATAIVVAYNAKNKASYHSAAGQVWICDGTNDDAEIQAAINSFAGLPGIVQLTDGKYNLAATITQTSGALTIQGRGIGVTQLLRTTDYGDTFKFSPTDPVNGQLYTSNLENLRIAHSTVKMTSGAAIHLKSAQDVTIRNVETWGHLESIWLEGVQTVTIDNWQASNGSLYDASTDNTSFFKATYGVFAATGGHNYDVHLSNFNAGADTVSKASTRNSFYINDIDDFQVVNGYTSSPYNASFLFDASVSGANVINTNISQVFFDDFNITQPSAAYIKTTGSAAGSLGTITVSNSLFGGHGWMTNAVSINSSILKGFKFINNEVHGFLNNGVDVLAGSNISIAGNQIAWCNASGGSYSGVNIVDNLDTILVSGNTIGGKILNDTATMTYGLKVGTGVTRSIFGPNTYGQYALTPFSIGSTQADSGLSESAITGLVNDLGSKAPSASPTFTGTVTMPITGSTQVLQVNSLGVVSGTGSVAGMVTSVTAGTGLTGGTITTTGTLSLANTTVAAGNYTNANITVDAQGRITTAASGSAGGVTSVSNADGSLTVTGTTTPDIKINQTQAITAAGFNATGGTSITQKAAAISPPGAPTLARVGGGNVAPGTYYYVVTAVDASGVETTKGAEQSIVVASTGIVTVNWTAVTGASAYRIYRSTVSGTYTSPSFIASTTAAQLTSDYIATPTAGAPPSSYTAGSAVTLAPGATSTIRSGNIGFGPVDPSATFEVNRVGISATGQWLTWNANINSANNWSTFGLGQYWGSPENPLAVGSGQNVGVYRFGAYDGTALSWNAAIFGITTEAQTTGAHGMALTFQTNANGGTTRNEKMRINGSGNVAIGNTNDVHKLEVTGDVAAKTFVPTIPAAVAPASTVTFDLSAGDSPSTTLGVGSGAGNTILAFTVTTANVGSWYSLKLKQDGSGNRTVTWPSSGLVCTFIKSDGTTTTTGPTLHTAASSVDTIVIHVTSTTTADCWAAGY